MLAVALRGWMGEKAAASTDSVCPALCRQHVQSRPQPTN